jgi:hypothetical protein
LYSEKLYKNNLDDIIRVIKLIKTGLEGNVACSTGETKDAYKILVET